MENRKLTDQPDAGPILSSDYVYIARPGGNPASLKGRIANLPVGTLTQGALDGKQPLDSDLTAIAALSTTSYGRSLLTQADAAAVKSSLAITSANVGDFSAAADARIAAQKGVAGGVATLDSWGKVPRAQLVVKPNAVLRNYVLAATWKNDGTLSDCRGVAWSPQLGLFAITARGSSTVFTSSDGISWTARTMPFIKNWQGICWADGLGLFIAVDNASTNNTNWIATSSDGVTWTSQTVPLTSAMLYVEWSAERGIVVATGQNGQIYTSTDGISWTARTSGVTSSILRCVWAAELGLFVAVMTGNTGNDVITSPDGINWTIRSNPARSLRGVTWSPELGLLVAVANSGTGSRVLTSPDATTWTARSTPSDATWNQVAWSPQLGLFVAFGIILSGGSSVMASTDGVTWSSIAGQMPVLNNTNDVIWAEQLGVFIAAPQGGGTGSAISSISAHSYPYRN